MANQYSVDNAVVTVHSDTEEKEEVNAGSIVENLQVKLLSPATIHQNDSVEFEVSYDVKDDIVTYLVFSMTDIDRNIWIYNDNTYNLPTKTKGQKIFRYKCSLEAINNLKLKLQVTILGESREMLAYATEANAPLIVMNRDDIPVDDFSAVDSAAGLVQRNGHWDLKE